MSRAAPQVLLTRPAYFQIIRDTGDTRERRTKRLHCSADSKTGGRSWALGLLYFPLLSFILTYSSIVPGPGFEVVIANRPESCAALVPRPGAPPWCPWGSSLRSGFARFPHEAATIYYLCVVNTY
jgi:hypothetical protein